MRLVIDTNVLISALISRDTPPDLLYQAWRDRRYASVSCALQIEEFQRVTRRAGARLRLKPAEAGRMVNDIRAIALMVDELPTIDRSPDPHDNYLLALAEAAKADVLVSGDKRDLLALKTHGRARILTAREALALIEP
jgi:putative PIN family toxin of toxin-antitoxin system